MLIWRSSTCLIRFYSTSQFHPSRFLDISVCNLFTVVIFVSFPSDQGAQFLLKLNHLTTVSFEVKPCQQATFLCLYLPADSSDQPADRSSNNRRQHYMLDIERCRKNGTGTQMALSVSLRSFRGPSRSMPSLVPHRLAGLRGGCISSIASSLCHKNIVSVRAIAFEDSSNYRSGPFCCEWDGDWDPCA